MSKGFWARRAPLLILVGGGALTALMAPRAPVEQEVRLVLGDDASRVNELVVRYAEPQDPQGEWRREARFHFAPGAAPRAVQHQPKLATGPHRMEIDIVADTSRATVRRDVTLEGTTSIELGRSVPR